MATGIWRAQIFNWIYMYFGLGGIGVIRRMAGSGWVLFQGRSPSLVPRDVAYGCTIMGSFLTGYVALDVVASIANNGVLVSQTLFPYAFRGTVGSRNYVAFLEYGVSTMHKGEKDRKREKKIVSTIRGSSTSLKWYPSRDTNSMTNE